MRSGRRRPVAWLTSLLEACVARPAVADPPVQWRVEDGGNGHWYQRVPAPEGVSWGAADLAARAAGGRLVTIAGQPEQEWVFANFVAGLTACGEGVTGRAHRIGLRQDPSSAKFAEPGGGWAWVAGAPVEFANWAEGEPNDGEGGSGFAGMRLDGRWDDAPSAPGTACFAGALVEWSADCDGDGIVDLGQILSGARSDANGDGVPDCCEDANASTDDCNANGERDACELARPGADADGDAVLDSCERAFGDLDLDGGVAAFDLSIMLASWGACAPESSCADLDGDGAVGASDLSILLARWGTTPPWLLPKIRSVSPASGPSAGGTVVTISGRNLGDATSVSIGGIAATSVTPVDARAVTAIAPAGFRAPGTSR